MTLLLQTGFAQHMAGIIPAGTEVWDAAVSAAEWGQTDSTEVFPTGEMEGGNTLFLSPGDERQALFLNGGAAAASRMPPMWRAASRRAVHPVSAEPAPPDPITALREGIAREYGIIYFSPVEPGDDERSFNIMKIMTVYSVNPNLFRNPQDWAALLRRTFFQALQGARAVTVYGPNMESRETRIKRRQEPFKTHPPRNLPLHFDETRLEEIYLRELFVLKPRRKDLKAAKAKRMEAYREKMWQRFLRRLQRKVRQEGAR